MRVIAGNKKGLKLIEFNNDNTRPTLDRVKENLFNIISSKVSDAEVLDIFGGTGNLSIEALSRGAKHAYINDINKNSISVIFKNISLTKYEKYVTILQNDYKKIIKKLYTNDKKFDIIFADAPYNTDMGVDSIKEINENNILKKDGIIILETDINVELPETIGDIFVYDKRKYGRVLLSFWKREE